MRIQKVWPLFRGMHCSFRFARVSRPRGMRGIELARWQRWLSNPIGNRDLGSGSIARCNRSPSYYVVDVKRIERTGQRIPGRDAGR